jgi:hypothetical protein
MSIKNCRFKQKKIFKEPGGVIAVTQKNNEKLKKREKMKVKNIDGKTQKPVTALKSIKKSY